MTKFNKILKDKHITQTQLSKNVGVTKACICHFVKYGIKSITAAKKYAAALGVDWQDLID